MTKNTSYPIEVLLKLIYKKLYKNKNQGESYLKNATKEKKLKTIKNFMNLNLLSQNL